MNSKEVINKINKLLYYKFILKSKLNSKQLVKTNLIKLNKKKISNLKKIFYNLI